MPSLDKVELHVFDNNRFVDIFRPGILSQQGVDTIKECIIMNDQLKVIKELNANITKTNDFNKVDEIQKKVYERYEELPCSLSDLERLARAEFVDTYGHDPVWIEGNGVDTDGDWDILPEPKVLTDRERFEAKTEEMVELFDRKNTDYGNSFEKSLDDDGLLVSKIRLTDKLNRFGQLIKNDSLVKDESLRDTLIDLANYTVMTLMYLDDNK